jgi:hypothetical protein
VFCFVIKPDAKAWVETQDTSIYARDSNSRTPPTTSHSPLRHAYISTSSCKDPLVVLSSSNKLLPPLSTAKPEVQFFWPSLCGPDRSSPPPPPPSISYQCNLQDSIFGMWAPSRISSISCLQSLRHSLRWAASPLETGRSNTISQHR